MGGLQGLLYVQSFHSRLDEKKKEITGCLLGLQYVQSFQGLQHTQNFYGRLEDKRKKEIMGCGQGSQYVQSFQGLQYAHSCHGQSEEKTKKEIMGFFQGLHYVQSFQGLQYGQRFHGRLEERRREENTLSCFQGKSEGKKQEKIMKGLQGLHSAQCFQVQEDEERIGSLQGLQKAQSFQDRYDAKRKKEIMSGLEDSQSTFVSRLEGKRKKEIMGRLQGLQKAQSFQDRSEKRKKEVMGGLKVLHKAQSFQDRSEENIKKEMMCNLKDLKKTQNFQDASEEREEIISRLKSLQYALSFHFPVEKKRKEIISGLQGSQHAQDFHGQSKNEKMGGLLGSENALNFLGLPEENLKKQIKGGFKRLQYSQSFQGRSEKGKKETTRGLQGLLFALSFQDRPSSSTIYPEIDAHYEHETLGTLLCAELQRLQGFGSYLSIGWLRQALDLCLSMHRELQETFPQIRQAVLRQNSKWMDETLDDTMKLLDVCNALREKMRDMKEYQEKLHIVLHCFNGRLGPWQLIRARKSLSSLNESLAKAQRKSRLENCSSMLRRIGEKRVASSAGAGLVEPIHAVKDLTVFVCGLLTAALSNKSRRSLPLPCTGHSAWACALQTLHFKAKKELERRGSRGVGRVFLDELHAVESSSRAVYHLLVNSKSVPLNEAQDLELRQSVVSLKNCVAELEDGMDSLESQINELFKVVVADRMALLDALTYS